MSCLVKNAAPAFSADAVMPCGSFETITLEQYKGQYVLLFFYPLDFTFVCPTEIIAFSEAIAKFEALNVQVLGVSIDSKFSHLAWRNTERAKGGIGDIKYPIISDLKKTISTDYGVLFEAAGIALRGTFLINKEGVVCHSSVNDLGLGRNVDEYLRLAEALQFSEEHGEVCPANWNKGDSTIDPAKSDEFFAKEYAGA